MMRILPTLKAFDVYETALADARSAERMDRGRDANPHRSGE